jgi:hypothetical protein
MTKLEFQKLAHDKRQQTREDKILTESERGWAGQHGQHPENEEEENYHPHNPLFDKNEVSEANPVRP